ncbi:hypothetical protein D0T53_00345 [Dysgonomonas sp. 216]|nr:hypothetical protein [Dysgonomonas sp. 216]
MIYITTFVLFVQIAFCACTKHEEKPSTASQKENVKTTRFSGNYNKTFNDLHDLHTDAAKKNGIIPMALRSDTIKRGEKLVRIPSELPLYKTDNLTHSVPYLVPKAADLFIEICSDFRDSLISKNIPLHKLILTSVTRTDEDIKKLTKRNYNASDNSAHCYGTTFDISWKRFEKINPYNESRISNEQLKLVLGQVLHNLRERNKCYIKHEKKQACFHITVR